MTLTGKLQSWNDDRGFGFIAPRDGGREIFVHVSAFPRDGSRPTVGETLVYEPGQGKDGKPQAVRVYRQAFGKPADYPTPPRRRTGRQSTLGGLLALLLVVALGAYGYKTFQNRTARMPARAAAPQLVSPAQASSARPTVLSPATTSFRCDGRTHCSQMTSCDEATFFLRTCPNTQMDGDNDGIPCETQWC